MLQVVSSLLPKAQACVAESVAKFGPCAGGSAGAASAGDVSELSQYGIHPGFSSVLW